MVKTPCFQCRGHGFDPWSLVGELRSHMLGEDVKLINGAREEGTVWGQARAYGKTSITNGQGLGHQSLSEVRSGGVCKLGTMV